MQSRGELQVRKCSDKQIQLLYASSSVYFPVLLFTYFICNLVKHFCFFILTKMLHKFLAGWILVHLLFIHCIQLLFINIIFDSSMFLKEKNLLQNSVAQVHTEHVHIVLFVLMMGWFFLAFLNLIQSVLPCLFECVSSDKRQHQNIFFIISISQRTDKIRCHDPLGNGTRSSVVILFFYKHEIIFTVNRLCVSYLFQKDCIIFQNGMNMLSSR